MKARRRRTWPYLILLLIITVILTWPAFVIAGTALAWLNGDAWQLEAWSQIPKRVLLQHFMDGYLQSLFIALATGLLLVIDHLLLSSLRLTRWLRGILLPMAGVAIALILLPSVAEALPVLLLSGILLAITYRLVDLLAAMFFRRSHR